MAEPLRPACEADVVDALSAALRAGEPLAITGGGSKAGAGRDVDARQLSMCGITGVVDYDPAELILTVRAGTPLQDVQALVASERQMLAFEPFDHGPIYGRASGAATIGGVVAAGVAGSRRLSAGGGRDHVLGVRAVSGRGELFVAGAKVVKNVTGYDLPKLLAGSWGRLAALTEVTLKVLPRPDTGATRFVLDLGPAQAVRAMAAAMGSQAEVACAAHRPAADGRPSITALRLEGFAPSVAARAAMLDRLLAPFGAVEHPGAAEAAAFWSALTTLDPLPREPALWRINVPPGAAPDVVATLGHDWLMDWAGGLIWIARDDADAVRSAAQAVGGHATLLRGDVALRARIAMFHPQPAPLAALETRVRHAFDPAGLFATGRF